ncbi:MAG: hypothetical protein ACYTGB_12560 [Planctomycetota bacterium]|jgi:hypothetical protein
MRNLSIAAVITLWGFALAGETVPAKFTQKPTAAKANGKVKITFAVDRETDVAVFIENAEGRVIRHLVAGVLGKNPPAPLKPGLSQSIEWDMRADYGKPAEGGPFKVRVALGVGAEYDKVLLGDPHTMGGPQALGVGPDGSLYAAIGVGIPGWRGEQMVAFNRGGTYQRMMMPFPAGLPDEEVKPFGTFDLEGNQVPLVKVVQKLSFYDSPGGPRKTTMAVTKAGHIYRFMSGEKGPCIAVLNARGGCPQKKFLAPPLLTGRVGYSLRPFMTLSTDEKYLFVTGLVQKKKASAVVYRVKLPDRTPAEPFFGDPAKAGKGQALLGGVPHGVSSDGKGNLLIADHKNDRVVVVNESDGKFVADFAVPKPDSVAVNPNTGEVFVTSFAGGKSGLVQLIKFSGWKEHKEVTKLALKFDGNPSYPGFVVGDFAAKPPLLWAAGERRILISIEDQGAKLVGGKTIINKKAGDAHMLDVTADRFRPDPEIYTRVAYSMRGNWWDRYSEATGKITRLQMPGLGRASGAQLVASPDGSLILPSYPQHLLKFTRDGKPSSWPEGSYPAEHIGKTGKVQKLNVKGKKKHGIFVPVSMTHCCHTIGVRHDGHVFTLEAAHPGGRPPKAMHEYTATGKRVTTDPIVWMVSDGAVGPKFDPQGNIYIAEIVKPLNQPYPEEFKKIFPELKMGETRPKGGSPQDNTANMYGSVVKFSPKGGMFHFKARAAHDVPYKGEPKLNGHKPTDASYYSKTSYKPVKVSGAEWIAPGYSHVEIRACNCQTTRFDVDEFGRVWFPDLNRFRVNVIDTNANPITHFGRYGNADNNTAKEESGIHFSWLAAVAVTDKNIYTGDALNRHVLKIKVTYAAEETVAVK